MAEKQFEENEYWSLDPEKEPNLIWSKEKQHKTRVPPPHYRDGKVIIPLPGEKTVRRGFLALKPGLLKRLSGGLLKDFNFSEQFETDFAPDFPGREILRGLKLLRDDVRGFDRDALIALDGVGPKIADKILAYFAKEAEKAAEIAEKTEGDNN